MRCYKPKRPVFSSQGEFPPKEGEAALEQGAFTLNEGMVALDEGGLPLDEGSCVPVQGGRALIPGERPPIACDPALIEGKFALGVLAGLSSRFPRMFATWKLRTSHATGHG